MKKLIIILSIGLLAACGTKSAKIQKIDADDITYFKDARTGLCFAAMGSRAGSDWSGEGTGMGMACVPCEALANVNVKTIR